MVREMRATERGQDELTNNEPAGGVDPLGEDFERAEGMKATCEGLGYLKGCKSLGIGTGTVQRIARELG